jgi:phosphoglycolate phosphatase
MYHAVDEVLPQLEALGLIHRLINPQDSKTIEDAKLVEHVRNYRQLHPKIKADRKISRTDIFEVLFGPDEEAKRLAHEAFNHSYRKHYGEVHPFEDNLRDFLMELKRYGLLIGILTNRDREFLEHELATIDGTGWTELFDTTVCGDDTRRRKPAPDPILQALDQLHAKPNLATWYVGDSTTDIIAAKAAGVTGVFYNGAQWDSKWLEKVFPGTAKHPYKPDLVVDNFKAFKKLVAMHLDAISADA